MSFQPANITFDLLPQLDEATRRRVRDKKQRHKMVCEKALESLASWQQRCCGRHARSCGQLMNRLSAIDSFAPAFARVRAMLFQPFRLGTWLKIGLIGLLGGGAISPAVAPIFACRSSSQRAAGELPPNAEDILRAIRSIHLADYFHVFVIVIAVIVVLALIFLYLFCRFRFILFDSVVTGQPDIGRGWRNYDSQANRYFGFWLAFRLVTWGALILIVGVPLWKAYKSGLFSGDNSLPIFFTIIASVALGALIRHRFRHRFHAGQGFCYAGAGAR